MASLVPLLILIALVPLAAGLGRGLGRSAKGAIALGAILFGLGALVDPPSKHAIESVEPEAEREGSGAPPAPNPPDA